MGERQARHVVDRVGMVRCDLRELRIGKHGLGAMGGLFGRLEQKDRPAPGRPLMAQTAGDGSHHRHVPVMTAHMRLAVDARAVRKGR